MYNSNRRRDKDLYKLIKKNYKVEMPKDDPNEYEVRFHGPKESLYEGGVWRVNIVIPENYPDVCPKISFVNKIFHINIYTDGEMCLDLLDDKWKPVFDLYQIFEYFLPHLLREEHNDRNPANLDAFKMMIRENGDYKVLVKVNAQLYAKKEDILGSDNEENPDDDQ